MKARLILGSFLLFGTLAGATSTTQVALIGCEPGSGEGLAKLEGRVVLDEQFLGTGTAREAAIDAAIALQLRFVQGYFQNDSKLREKIVLSLGSYREGVTILSKKAVTYPANLQIDAFRGSSGSAYVTNAIKRGKTSVQDKALEVIYSTQRKLAFCKKLRSATLSSTAWVPVDPYLALWNVLPEKRVTMANGGVSALVSPCASKQMLVFGGPDDFWYLWTPFAEGVDAGGKAYSCEKAMANRALSVPIKFSVAQAQPSLGDTLSFGDLPKNGAPVRVSLFFGNIVRANKEGLGFRQPDLAGLRRKLPQYFKTDLDESARRKYLDEAASGGSVVARYEPGTLELFGALIYMPNIIEIESVAFDQKLNGPESFFFSAKGRFKGSRVSAEVSVYYGPTTVFDELKPMHWQPLLNALAHDSVVIYNGHAGLGETVSLHGIQKHLGLPKEEVEKAIRSNPYLFLGLLSCDAYYHFGEDLLASRESGKTDILMTVSTDVGAKYVLGILKLVDRGLSGEKIGLEASLGRFVAPDSFLILKRKRLLGL